MKLNEYPQPEIRPLADDDAPTILLDPGRTIHDFGQMTFAPLDEIVAKTVSYYQLKGIGGSDWVYRQLLQSKLSTFEHFRGNGRTHNEVRRMGSP